MKKLEKLVSLQSQVKAVRLQDKLGKQNFHEDMKKIFKPVTNSLENTSRDITKTISETSLKNNQAIEKLNNKLLEIMDDRGVIESYLMSPLSKITNPENSSQFKLLKDPHSKRVNDLLIHNNRPITLHDNLLAFRDTNKQFELKRDLLKMITNKNYNFDPASLSDEKLMYDFGKETHFDISGPGNKNTGDRTIIKLLKSPVIMASGIPTIFLPSDPNELCHRLKLLLHEKHADNNCNIFNEEIIAIDDKLLQYKRISKKQHKQILIERNLS